MPFSDYLPEHMGTAVLTPAGPFIGGSYAELTIVYTAGKFGIDDTGMLKISWRTTSDMSKPQFKDPAAPNYTTVEASNGAELEYWFDRLNIRPWANTLLIRVGRGFMREGETITVRFGDRRKGSAGYRLQTNCEERFELKTCVDAFAAYEFVEVPEQPAFEIIAGPADRWKAILPSLAVIGEPFRLALVAEDMWGNPTDDVETTLTLAASASIEGLPHTVSIKRGEAPHVIEGLIARETGDIDLYVLSDQREELARANPLRVVTGAPLRRYWGDLHAQSGETIGTNPAESYIKYARDKAFVDMVGHQGNDFQITDAFWAELNRLTKAYEVPGRFVAVPGYEWSGNTGMGGDRNIFFRHEGRPIRRSSRVLTRQESAPESDCHTAHDIFRALQGEDCLMIAHVGGRYADLSYAHDKRLERTVEVHSTWGTFEWLLHDAFARGYRVGIVCHSDDHKGRPGATRPGASTFGAIGGLTCYFMPDLTRDALFTALRKRHHYGTTGTRLFIDLAASFERNVTGFSEDPQLGPTKELAVRTARMGDILRTGAVPMRLTADVIGTAPIERVEVLHGTRVAHAVCPYAAADLGKRVRLLWEGAEYRGRGRETNWRGQVKVQGNRFTRFAPVNFLNPERKVTETEPGTGLSWTSVTTGNRAGLDIWLEDAGRGTLTIDTNVVSGEVALATLGDSIVAFDGGGLGRKLSVYRLPDEDWSRHVELEHTVTFTGDADLPVYLRVTQADGHQAWTSPIYLIA